MEILVYIATLVVLFSAVISFLFWAMRSGSKAGAMREVSDNIRRAMEIMIYEIKEAKSVYTPTTNFQQLSLETIKYLPSGEESSFIDFYIDAGTLYFKKESQNPIALISNKVEAGGLAFTATSSTPPSIQITLEINYKNPNNRPEHSASSTASSTASIRSY